MISLLFYPIYYYFIFIYNIKIFEIGKYYSEYLLLSWKDSNYKIDTKHIYTIIYIEYIYDAYNNVNLEMRNFETNMNNEMTYDSDNERESTVSLVVNPMIKHRTSNGTNNTKLLKQASFLQETLSTDEDHDSNNIDDDEEYNNNNNNIIKNVSYEDIFEDINNDDEIIDNYIF